MNSLHETYQEGKVFSSSPRLKGNCTWNQVDQLVNFLNLKFG